MKRKSIFPNTKLGKTSYLNENDKLKAFVPDTTPENKENLAAYLNKYRMVYVKPNNGTGGRGVMRVEITKEGKYHYQLGKQSHTFSSLEPMYDSLHKITSKRKHLIQKGIHLLKYHKRSFDIRIMIQKNLKGRWENTGIIGRLAHPKKIVTNYHSGGTPIALNILLTPYLKKDEITEFIKKLNHLGLEIAQYLHRGYPYVTAIGVDVALDSDLKPWILEVNTKPDPYIFKKLKDSSVFRKIFTYVRANRKRKVPVHTHA